jgi:O-antigen/teichoic acid export membrane protein
MIVGLFVGIWVARYLGPAQFGLFSYAQSFVGLFTAFATLGLDGIVVRELVKDEMRRDELIGTAFWLKLMGAIAVLLILAIAVNFTSNDHATNVIVFIVASATVFQAFNVVDFYFQSKVMGKYIVFANVISLLTSSIVKIVLILNEAPLVAFAWTVLFDNFVLACGYIYFYLHQGLSFKYFQFNTKTAFVLLKNGIFFSMSAVLIAFYMKIDQVMIKEMLNNEAVGQYAAAVRLSEAWYFIPILIASSLYPAIENAKKISQDLYYQRLQRLFDFAVIFSVIIGFFTIIFSDKIVEILYGSQYNLASSVLTIHIWALVFASLRVTSEYWVLSENLIYFEVFKTFLGLGVNVIFNLWLIKYYGIQGAAIATLIAMAVTGYFSYAFHSKGRKIFTMMTKSLLMINLIKRIKNARNI